MKKVDEVGTNYRVIAPTDRARGINCV